MALSTAGWSSASSIRGRIKERLTSLFMDNLFLKQCVALCYWGNPQDEMGDQETLKYCFFLTVGKVSGSGLTTIKPRLTPNRTRSALFLMLNVSMMWCLWNSTVFSLKLRIAAISFIGRPSANNCTTSRCRLVKSFKTGEPWPSRPPNLQLQLGGHVGPAKPNLLYRLKQFQPT